MDTCVNRAELLLPLLEKGERITLNNLADALQIPQEIRNLEENKNKLC